MYLATIMVHKLDARDRALELVQRAFDRGVRDARIGALPGVLEELPGDGDADAVQKTAAGCWRGRPDTSERFVTGDRGGSVLP